MPALKPYRQIAEEHDLTETEVTALVTSALEKLYAELHDRCELIELVTGTPTTVEDYLADPALETTYRRIMRESEGLIS